MQNNRRETLLKVAVGVAVGLFLLDWAIVSPAIARWKAQSERIADLSAKVKRGRQLLEREQSIRARWAEMLRTDLPDDPSSSENDVFKAIGRWTRESRVGFSNLTQQWRTHEEGFDTLELRTNGECRTRLRWDGCSTRSKWIRCRRTSRNAKSPRATRKADSSP
jgi:hypothetical protein